MADPYRERLFEEPPPRPYEVVFVLSNRVPVIDIERDFVDWLNDDSVSGVWSCRKLLLPERFTQYTFKFSDANTAFAFKMRWVG